MRDRSPEAPRIAAHGRATSAVLMVSVALMGGACSGGAGAPGAAPVDAASSAGSASASASSGAATDATAVPTSNASPAAAAVPGSMDSPAAATAVPTTGAEAYAKGCASCHSSGIGGAPQVGDHAAWGLRIAQGKQTLYRHSLAGKGGMPARGGTTWPDATIRLAVDYMVELNK